MKKNTYIWLGVAVLAGYLLYNRRQTTAPPAPGTPAAEGTTIVTATPTVRPYNGPAITPTTTITNTATNPLSNYKGVAGL